MGRTALHGIDINLKDTVVGFTAFHNDSYSGHVEVVRLLLQVERINDNHTKDECGSTALQLASDKGHAEDGSFALHNASNEGHTQVVRLLLQKSGIDVNQKNTKGHRALHLASLMSHTEVLKLLPQKDGTDVNARETLYGQTALHVASSMRRLMVGG